MARLHRALVETLLRRIAGGEYEPGSLLPKEQLLASEFDVSRGTAREAIRALEERGVTRVKHGRGARVQPLEQWDVLDPVVAEVLATGTRRREFVREIEALRRLLETEAAALAANAPARQRQALRQAADTGDPGQIRELVAVASGNRPLAATLRALRDAVAPTVTPQQAEACRRLARAIADGDEPAAREHVASLHPPRR